MVVDFVVYRPSRGKEVKEVHEYKGKFFAKLMEYKTKKALFTWCYPDLPHITVLKGDIII